MFYVDVDCSFEDVAQLKGKVEQVDTSDLDLAREDVRAGLLMWLKRNVLSTKLFMYKDDDINLQLPADYVYHGDPDDIVRFLAEILTRKNPTPDNPNESVFQTDEIKFDAGDAVMQLRADGSVRLVVEKNLFLKSPRDKVNYSCVLGGSCVRVESFAKQLGLRKQDGNSTQFLVDGLLNGEKFPDYGKQTTLSALFEGVEGVVGTYVGIEDGNVCVDFRFDADGDRDEFLDRVIEKIHFGDNYYW